MIVLCVVFQVVALCRCFCEYGAVLLFCPVLCCCVMCVFSFFLVCASIIVGMCLFSVLFVWCCVVVLCCFGVFWGVPVLCMCFCGRVVGFCFFFFVVLCCCCMCWGLFIVKFCFVYVLVVCFFCVWCCAVVVCLVVLC